MQCASLRKQLGADGHNLDVRLVPEQLQQARKTQAVFRPAQAVTYFQQYELRGEQPTGKFQAQAPGRNMPLIRRVEQGEKINRVRKNGAHGLGAPCR